MFRILNAVILIAAAILILIQKDVDGGLLINGWQGLGLACITVLVVGIINLFHGVDELTHGE